MMYSRFGTLRHGISGQLWYFVPMIKYGVAVYECEKCGHRWLPEKPGVLSARCPNRKCRSTSWHTNTRATIDLPGASAAATFQAPRPSLPTIVTIPAAPLPNSVIEAADRCRYTEYVGEIGDTIQCRLTAGHRLPHRC